MTVNQRIKKAIQRGDIAKISKILGISPPSVSERINSEKEIDSVDLINAVAEVTGKPFQYFKKIYEVNVFDNLPSPQEPIAEYRKKISQWESRYDELLKRYKLLEGALEDNRHLVDLLSSTNKDLKRQLEDLKSRDVRK